MRTTAQESFIEGRDDDKLALQGQERNARDVEERKGPVSTHPHDTRTLVSI
jgi:hypothetical protein